MKIINYWNFKSCGKAWRVILFGIHRDYMFCGDMVGFSYFINIYILNFCIRIKQKRKNHANNSRKG